MAHFSRTLCFIVLVALAAGLIADAASAGAWLVYAYQGGSFTPLPFRLADDRVDQSPCSLAGLPVSWHVPSALQTDLNRDGVVECTLLVWRPWEDWPIMRWSDTPSPIAGNRDAQGDSAHIILIDPHTQRELWAGSALSLPIVQIAAGDVDGDGGAELIALEGDYDTGRYGPARDVAVWRWNGFGFTLAWRSPRGRFAELVLSDVNDDAVSEILIR